MNEHIPAPKEPLTPFETQMQETINEQRTNAALLSSATAPDTRPPSEPSGLAAAIRAANPDAAPLPSEGPEFIADMLKKEEELPLNPEELQALREIIYSEAKRNKSRFELPELPITEDDRDLFSECIVNHRPYKESFSMMKGKLRVTFREKLKRETDAIFNQIETDMRNGLIRSELAMSTRIQNYNLAIQLTEVNGAPCPVVVPISVPADWTLESAMKNHVSNTFSENTMFILLSALSQFDQKIRKMSQEVVKENFSQPAAVS